MKRKFVKKMQLKGEADMQANPLLLQGLRFVREPNAMYPELESPAVPGPNDEAGAKIAHEVYLQFYESGYYKTSSRREIEKRYTDSQKIVPNVRSLGAEISALSAKHYPHELLRATTEDFGLFLFFSVVTTTSTLFCLGFRISSSGCSFLELSSFFYLQRRGAGQRSSIITVNGKSAGLVNRLVVTMIVTLKAVTAIEKKTMTWVVEIILRNTTTMTRTMVGRRTVTMKGVSCNCLMRVYSRQFGKRTV